MKTAIDAVEEMSELVDAWRDQFPEYKDTIKITEVDDKKYPFKVTLTLTNENTET
jgi:hypothetical protein